MSTQDLKNAVMNATQSFIRHDVDLLRLKVYEPSVSHRIAFYLERDSFKEEFHVDCEYDKRFDQEKPGPNGKPMRPDIIVHTRNQMLNNVIAIEVKKARESRRDIEKLEMLTRKDGQFKYKLGCFLYFKNREPQYIWVDGGKIQTDL